MVEIVVGDSRDIAQPHGQYGLRFWRKHNRQAKRVACCFTASNELMDSGKMDD
jgi:hypothetical protein